MNIIWMITSTCVLFSTVHIFYSANAVISENYDTTELARRIPGNCSDKSSYDCGEKCIPTSRLHDCRDDCADRSDEVCWPGFVMCPTGTSCACVKEADAAQLCVIRSSSKLCTLPSIFRCNNGNCILREWLNDRKNDCGDWSDEQLSALEPVAG